MFEYFPNNYPWSLAVMSALNRGGHIAEVDEACRPQIVDIIVNAAHRDAANDLAHITQIVGREGRAHAKVLDVASAAGAQGMREPDTQAAPIGNVQNGKPAHEGVESRERQRVRERIAAEMRHLPRETGAAGQIDADLMQLRLQLQRRDVASCDVGKVTGGAANTGSNVEHTARGSKPECVGRRTNGVGTMIVPLIDGKELLRPNGIVAADTKGGQRLLDALQVRVERHRTDRRWVTHAPVSSNSPPRPRPKPSLAHELFLCQQPGES